MKLQFAALLLAAAVSPAQATTMWTNVDKAMGRPAMVQPGDVHRYSFPRSDLNVMLDGVRIRPALALGSWLAFRDMADHAEVMGDLVLTQEEVNPVLSRLLASGLTITALHNHLLRSSPATMYMHVHGMGDAVKLATALRGALSASRTPTGAPGAATQTPLGLDTAALDSALKSQGKAAGGTYQYSFPRAETVRDEGMPLPAALGLATAINFQPTGAGRAVATGDFVLIASEVPSVLQALRRHGIDVTALHNHLAGEEPRLFFMHFWGNDRAIILAQGLRAALDRMNLKR
ncbi:DUF1259 domain-containing protein [Sphingomonas sp. KRR8]|uniref:DUF1259 domain-containing protein n=1 Tax=Sphingomonas sp. KRR8 TaxID=2942996 RepID=UPI00201FE639|nr:DUF1259 domain-containing protein [Sphingomonas sp. KRR8]URD61255.1 DUF1259 domain-containing protein [Sphingomonas sp. KRR8]